MTDALPVLPDDDACAAAIGRMGEIDRDLAAIEAKKSAAVSAATKIAEDSATPLQGERAELEAKVAAYCAANRPRLTSEGKTKTVTFATGEVSWRLGKEKLQVDDSMVDKLLAALTKMRLGRFIKVTRSISTQGILAATEAERKRLARLKGLAFVPPGESFTIKPVAAALADRPPAEGASAA
ncbi:MAG: host-nuclease inhibitor Gam family protein [Rhizobiales bacterium]|nr:host-nuclease inhibitor Gam family protein [Hyphomicrobiales bacterium]